MNAGAISNTGVDCLQDVTPTFLLIAPALQDHSPVVGLFLLPLLTPVQGCMPVMLARRSICASEWDNLQDGTVLSEVASHSNLLCPRSGLTSRIELSNEILMLCIARTAVGKTDARL